MEKLKTEEKKRYELFKEQCEAIQDAQVKEFSDHVVGLDSELMALALHFDEEFYPRFPTTIAGRRHSGLVAGIDHGKVGRDLANITAYDPSVEACIDDNMSLLHLEGPSPETLKISRLQPSYEQLLLPIHRKEDNVVTKETSLYDSLDVVHAGVQKLKEDAFTSGVPVIAATTTALAISVTAANINSIPPILVANYDMPDAGV
ncbi:hypothetical protein Tco_1297573 [Tanacetum coccineum]